MTANGFGVSFWGDENVLELDNDGGCTTQGMYQTNATFKWLILFYVNVTSIKIS